MSNNVFPYNGEGVKALIHAYMDGGFYVGDKKITTEELLRQILEEIENNTGGGSDKHIVSIAANAQGQLIATLNDNTEVPFDLSDLPEFDSVSQAQGNLEDERLWVASPNNDFGTPGMLILNRE